MIGINQKQMHEESGHFKDKSISRETFFVSSQVFTVVQQQVTHVFQSVTFDSESNMLLRHVRNYSLSDTASHPRRLESS
jgi:hypothetical protein